MHEPVRLATLGSRFDQPNFSVPRAKHSFRCREENGIFNPSSIFGSLARRSCTGSIRSFSASSSIADSVAHSPGTAPGPRIAVGDPTLRRASAEVTFRFGTLYRYGVASPQFSL